MTFVLLLIVFKRMDTEIKVKRTVEDGFHELIKKLNPKFSEPEYSESNLHLIEKLLQDNFDMSYMIRYGSGGHGTHIARYSAIDCFAVIPKDKLHEDSLKSLEKIHEILLPEFPDATIREGRPAIIVQFGGRTSDKHCIVPAYEIGEKNGQDVFGIPGPSGRWIQSCPGGHSAWINKLNDNLNKRLRNMIRVIKAWNYYNDQPLWSFYIELCVADYFKSDYSILFSVDVRNFLKYLHQRGLKPFEGSVGSNEVVYGTSKDDREAALAKIYAAVEMADKAVRCEQTGNISEAFYWWRKVFNFRFPAF